MRQPRKWQPAAVCLLLLALTPLAFTPRGSAQSSAYTVTDVVAAAGTQSLGLGLDPCGRVVGQSGPAGGSGQHPFYWDGAQVTDIGTYNGGDSGVAYAVNPSGAVAGWAYNQFDAQHVFVWSAPGPKTDICPSCSNAVAYDINPSGIVAGQAEVSTLQDHAFVWKQSAGLQTVPASWGTPVAAYGVNAGGDAVGSAMLASGSHAFVWHDQNGDAAPQAAEVADLGTLGGQSSVAFDIGDAGHVVGYAHIAFSGGGANRPYHAFRWKDADGDWARDAGEMLDLGTLGGTSSIAYGVNSLGQVVGASETSQADGSGLPVTHAFVWSDDNGNGSADAGEMKDLNALAPGTGWTFTEARAVNALGQIVGTGLKSDGKSHAFLLTPSASVSNVSGSGTYNGTATLTATLAVAGTQAAGRTVSFTLNGTPVGSAQTDAGGVATLAGVSLSGVGAGAHAGAVGASFGAAGCAALPGGSGTGTLTVAKATPAITWNNPAPVVYGTALGATQLNAAANVPGSFAYKVSGGGAAAGVVLHVGSGQTLHADFTPTDANNYNAASKDVTIDVTRATLTVAAADKSRAYKQANPALTYNITGFVNGDTPDVVSGTPALSTAADATSAPGAYAITASANSLSASDYAFAFVNGTLTVTKADQTVGFAKPPDKTFGDAPFNVSATGGGSTSPVTFAAAGNCAAGGANGATITINAAGNCTVTASQAGDTNYNAAPDVSQSFQIGKAGSTTTVVVSNATYDGQPHGATASVTGAGGLSQGVAVTYTGRNGTVYPAAATPPTNAGDYTASASFAGDDNHTVSSDSKDFQIAKAAQTITFAEMPNRTFGDPDFALTATASSGLAVSFSALPADPCEVNGSTVHLKGAGTCHITASQAGNQNYTPATSVERSFTIANGGQTITFAALPDRTFGDPAFTVSATASSGLTVKFTAAGSCAAGGTDGATITLVGAGSCTVTASQPGDANFGPAEVSRAFQIAKAATTTALSTSASPAAGQAVTFTASVSSNAGVPTGSVQFKVDGANFGAPAALNAGGVAALQTSNLAPGAHTVSADYSSDANFFASSAALAGGQVVGSVFEFSAPLYTVGERGGSVAVAVRRTGDAGAAASVDYATDDGSVPTVTVPCSTPTGLALERCDYTRAAGTLAFAAGETVKSFNVLVNDDTYTEGPESISLRLSNPGGAAALGAQASSTLQITDDQTESAGNPVDSSAFFVRQHYHDFLNREPDDPGLAFWTNEIEKCGADAQCRELRRINVSAAFFLAIEFQETGYLVERMYKASFGDAVGVTRITGAPVQIPVPVVRRAEFLSDRKAISDGVIVGQDGWPQVLEANKTAFAQGFVRRQRFTNLYPETMAAGEFVAKLFANAGAVPTAAERDAAVAAFGAGGVAGRAAALRKVAESASVDAAEKNRAFVLMQFFGYLQRDPDAAPDSDHTGYQFWLDKLDQFGGNFVRAQMVKAFLDSIEYRTRFAP